MSVRKINERHANVDVPDMADAVRIAAGMRTATNPWLVGAAAFAGARRPWERHAAEREQDAEAASEAAEDARGEGDRGDTPAHGDEDCDLIDRRNRQRLVLRQQRQKRDRELEERRAAEEEWAKTFERKKAELLEQYGLDDEDEGGGFGFDFG